jgi:hypothetical protein
MDEDRITMVVNELPDMPDSDSDEEWIIDITGSGH